MVKFRWTGDHDIDIPDLGRWKVNQVRSVDNATAKKLRQNPLFKEVKKGRYVKPKPKPAEKPKEEING